MIKLTKKLKEMMKFLEDNPELTAYWNIPANKPVSFVFKQNVDPNGCICKYCNYCCHGPKVIVKEFVMTDSEHLKFIEYNETAKLW